MSVNVSRKKAEKVLAGVKSRFDAYIEPGYSSPVLMKDFDGRRWTILWEEGPYQWPLEHGVPESMPEGVFVEPINHYSVGVYPV